MYHETTSQKRFCNDSIMYIYIYCFGVMFIGEKQREKHVRENDHCNSVKTNKERDRDIIARYCRNI